VWCRGKDGDYIKVLPIAIKVTGRIVKEVFLFWIGANCVGGPYE
jgi:hypothetical protein